MKLKTKFQDEDFELGEVVNANIFYGDSNRIKLVATAANGGEHTFCYNSLAHLNEDWEDAPEEPKEYWIPMSNEPYPFVGNDWETEGLATGLISLSKEENEIKREKLKAWERLKDKGFKFESVEGHEALCGNGFNIPITATMPPAVYADDTVSKDLNICFGGEK